MKFRKPIHAKEAWIAIILTTGEFVAGIWLLVHEGHVLALYLAVTYASRETLGGRHYHTVIAELVRGSWTHYMRRRKE